MAVYNGGVPWRLEICTSARFVLASDFIVFLRLPHVASLNELSNVLENVCSLFYGIGRILGCVLRRNKELDMGFVFLRGNEIVGMRSWI